MAAGIVFSNLSKPPQKITILELKAGNCICFAIREGLLGNIQSTRQAFCCNVAIRIQVQPSAKEAKQMSHVL